MLKTMKNQMLPERGEGCRCKGKTPKTFMYVCKQDFDFNQISRGVKKCTFFEKLRIIVKPRLHGQSAT